MMKTTKNPSITEIVHEPNIPIAPKLVERNGKTNFNLSLTANVAIPH